MKEGFEDLKEDESFDPETSRLKHRAGPLEGLHIAKNVEWAFSAMGLSESYSSFPLFDDLSMVHCKGSWLSVLLALCKKCESSTKSSLNFFFHQVFYIFMKYLFTINASK